MDREKDNLETVRSFFAALDRGATESDLATFYSRDILQEEFPNAFLPDGARRGFEELREAAARGKQVMASQTFEVLAMLASGDTVVVEANWTGTLAVPLGESTPAGTVMRARFAQFFELREGKIVRQRNYDCFYPW